MIRKTNKFPLSEPLQTGRANMDDVNQSCVSTMFEKMQAIYGADNDEDVARIIANSKIIYAPKNRRKTMNETERLKHLEIQNQALRQALQNAKEAIDSWQRNESCSIVEQNFLLAMDAIVAVIGDEDPSGSGDSVEMDALNKVPTAHYSIGGVVKFLRNSDLKDHHGGKCACCPDGDHIFARHVEFDAWQTDRPAHFGNGADVFIASRVTDKNEFEGRRIRFTVEVLEEGVTGS